MSENRMWDWLRNQAHKNEPDLFLQRINDRLIGGIADVHWALDERFSGWFEMKHVKKLGTPLDIRPDQTSWLMQYPGRAGVLVRTGNGPRCVWFYFPAGKTVEWSQRMQSRFWMDLRPRFEWREGQLTHYDISGRGHKAIPVQHSKVQDFTIETFLDVLETT